MVSRTWGYRIPVRVIFGRKSLGKLPEIVREFEPEKILLVTGRKSMEKFGILNRVENLLKDYKITLFNRIEPNPSVETIEEGAEICKRENPDLIIALGGGSPMDAAKAIGLSYANGVSIRELLYDRTKIKKKGPPIIAIPTTSGTASEVTKYSVVTDFRNEFKKGFGHEYNYPEIALIDPELTKYMPREVTATTGLDALAHAVEAFWSTNSNPATDLFAKEAIELIYNNLLKALEQPENMEPRENMSLASLFAGFAFDTTVTNCLHSIAHPLTYYFGIPHGHACVLGMVEFMKFNQDAAREKLLEISRITGVGTVKNGIKNIQGFLEKTGLPMRLGHFGAGEKDLDKIIEKYDRNIMVLNPKRVTEEDVRRILLKIL